MNNTQNIIHSHSLKDMNNANVANVNRLMQICATMNLEIMWIEIIWNLHKVKEYFKKW